MCLRHICRADLFRGQKLLMARCRTANVVARIFGTEWIGLVRGGEQRETEKHERGCEREGKP